MFENLSKHRKLFGVILIPILALCFAGCSSGDSPTGPGDPDPEPTIQTPVGMIIQSITITSFASKKLNGDYWDWDPISSDPRRPDVYVTLARNGGAAEYKSTWHSNAHTTATYNCSTEANSSSKSLPIQLDSDKTCSLAMYDYDALSADDKMGQADFVPANIYTLDNAQNFTYSISGTGSTRFYIRGVWVY